MDSDDRLRALMRAFPDALDGVVYGCEAASEAEFARHCARHGLAGLVHHHLLSSSRCPALLHALRPYVIEQELIVEILEERLREVVGRLLALGLSPIILKGPVLAARIYPRPAARMASDLDLFVPEAELELASTVLAGLGYQAPPSDQAATYRAHHHHLIWTRPNSPSVELHFRFQSSFGGRFPAEVLSRRACAYTWRGTSGPVCVLSPEDEFLYLVVHAASHRFIRLSWLYDLKLFVRAYPDFDWPSVWDRAQRFGFATILRVSARILYEHLGVSLPGWMPDQDSFKVRLVSRTLCLDFNESRMRRRLTSFVLGFLLSDRVGHGLARLLRRGLHFYRRSDGTRVT